MSKTLIQKIRGLQTSKKVLVMGSAVIDVILQLDKLPVTGQDIMAEHKKTIVGGCAYNVTNILKQLNFKHDLIVPVGRGANADLIRKQLKDDNHDIVLEEDTQDNGWNLSIVEKGQRKDVHYHPRVRIKLEECLG
ncbi:PfkB family carbohydrate kinase [Paenibacillus larvae]|uniref:PfkB family carbohydrate kinase n=1 Tax=Paenibacillus larvae TaxID=1464 RepID=UPI001E2C29DA|nr:PfkB family carbohydrate kinase [Paenibacillus larvae]MCY7520785.1 PfkB family carbohydrate kinase [Paenibacillus larvae]MCY9747835.1 PfkB family carbohydrate kinase [Paenibacillus larvae]MDR5606176.1 PfkB family carbohydrate kinase [Paenibacillus larvae]MEC0088731.1 PfkB family carbohydrate kinase [Paenibacillus larvae]MEC0188912.1 PfkB family carbohydrate kinase [Paenibacillus larvae]